MEIFARRLLALKEAKNVSQKQLIADLGIPKKTMYNYEHGASMPDLDKLIALADYFNVSLDYLVGRSDNPKRI